MWRLLLWLVCLPLAIYAGRRKKELAMGCLHGFAFGMSTAYLESIVSWSPIDPKRWLLYAAALGAQVLVVIIAGAIWPKCKACGAHKFETARTADGEVKYCAVCRTPKGER